MKTAEEMMVDWLESEHAKNGKVELKVEQFFKIYNWFQEVEMAMERQDTMTRAKRVDNNHKEIVQGLRDCGFLVKDTSAYGNGFVDCIVAGGGRVVMLEIKNGNAKLTEAEKEFHGMFHGLGVYIVRTVEQALEVMRKESI